MSSQDNTAKKLAEIETLLRAKFPHVTWKVEQAYSPTKNAFIDVEDCVNIGYSSHFTLEDEEEFRHWYLDKIPDAVLYSF